MTYLRDMCSMNVHEFKSSRDYLYLSRQLAVKVSALVYSRHTFTLTLEFQNFSVTLHLTEHSIGDNGKLGW